MRSGSSIYRSVQREEATNRGIGTAASAGDHATVSWRLETEASAFEAAYRRVHEKFRLGPFKELRMKFLTAAVRWLLMSLKAGKGLAPTDLVPECVAHSGIIEAQRVGSGEKVTG